MYYTEQTESNNKVPTPELQVIRKPETLNMLGISKSNFHNKINEGLLPPGISLGPNSTGYLKHEICAVIAAMATNKSQSDIKELIKSLVSYRENLAK